MKNCKNYTRKNVKIQSPVVLLKIMKQQYPNAPKRSQLIDELIREFSFFSEFPETTEIHLKAHYSHKLIKRVLAELGYGAYDWQRHFSSTRIFKIN